MNLVLSFEVWAYNLFISYSFQFICSLIILGKSGHLALFQFEFPPFKGSSRTALRCLGLHSTERVTWSAVSNCLAGNMSPPPWPSPEICILYKDWVQGWWEHHLLRNWHGFGFWTMQGWVDTDSLGFRTTLGQVHADRTHWASALGCCRVLFTLRGAQSSQDLLEAVLLKKKGKKSEKKWGDGACVWLTSEDPGEGLDVENWVFS